MSEIKALEKLRVSEDAADYQWIPSDYLNQIADKIEAEIAEAREITRKKHQAERVYWHNELHKILDAINGQERFWGDCMDYPLPEATVPPSEVAKRMLSERYMLLPVDADGVPIHVGEEMTCHGDVFKVCAVAPAKIHRWVTVKLGEPQTTYSYDPTECAHYKPRTLEDVLAEFGIAAARELNADPDGYGISDKTIAKCASEIRDLLGGDE